MIQPYEISLLVLQGIVLLLGYLFTFWFTTLCFNKLILKNGNQDINKDGKADEKDQNELSVGKIIGKCENVMVITFIIANEITGLALIFAAKNIVRADKIKENASFYLAGTLVNFTASLIIGYCLKILINQL